MFRLLKQFAGPLKESHTTDTTYLPCENDNNFDICDKEVSRLTSCLSDNNMESTIPSVESVFKNQIVSNVEIENADVDTGLTDNVISFVPYENTLVIEANDKVNENSDVTVEDLYNLEVNDLVKMLDKEPEMIEYVGALMNQENFGEYISSELTSELSHAEVAFPTISDELNQPSVSDPELDVLLNDIFNASSVNEQIANNNNETDASPKEIYQASISMNELEKIQHVDSSNNKEESLSAGFPMPIISPDLYREQN